jgi:hypothetical protein
VAEVERLRNRKLKEEREMTIAAMQNANRDELRELAQGWGKILAAEAFPRGVGPTIDFNQMEELAGEGARALVQGMLREAVWKQGLALGDVQPCPTCGTDCRVEWNKRTVQSRYGEVEIPEPHCHCNRCRRDFFPSKDATSARRS